MNTREPRQRGSYASVHEVDMHVLPIVAISWNGVLAGVIDTRGCGESRLILRSFQSLYSKLT